MASTSTSPPPYENCSEAASSSSLFASFKQSLSSFTLSPSKVDVTVLPFDSVDMYGPPDAEYAFILVLFLFEWSSHHPRRSAYSLSGQIAVNLVPPVGLFGEAPAADESFVLESLVVTFEGQSELVTPETGYSACRLIEFSQELLVDSPLRLQHTWAQGSPRDPARWFIVFNLTVPGWLPASSHTAFGDSAYKEPEISYRLSATAKYREDKSSAKSSWRSAYYGSAVHTAQTSGTSVKINRYTLPSSSSPLNASELPSTLFKPVEYTGVVEETASQIPKEILSKLRMRAYVPEHIPMDSGSFPLLLTIRPDDLPAEERERLRLTGFSISAAQREIHR